MDDFSRTINTNLFEDISISMNIFIRYSSNNEQYHDEKNKTSIKEFAEKIKGLGSIKCFFQNFDKNSKGFNIYRIILCISENEFITINVSPFRDSCTFLFQKIRSINSIDLNGSDYIEKECSVNFIYSLQTTAVELFNNSFVDMGEISKFFDCISKLPIPKKDIEKAKEQKIWMSYIDALKRFVKKKETIWKVKKITEPKLMDGKWRFEVTIDESNLIRDFKEEISGLFQNYLGNHKITLTSKSVIIEFDKYKELAETDKETLINISKEYFFELDNDSPLHSVEGELYFLSDDIEKQAITSNIEDSFAEFDLEINKDENGSYIFVEDKEREYLSQIVTKEYSNTVSIIPNTKIICKLSFPKDIELLLKELSQFFPEGISQNGNFIIGKINRKLIDIDIISKMSTLGLEFDSCKVEFKPKEFNPNLQISGLLIKDNYYYNTYKSIDDLNKTKFLFKKLAEKANTLINSSYIYVFKIGANKTKLRELKSILLAENNISVIVSDSKIKFTPEIKEEYYQLRGKVFELMDDVDIEDISYKASAKFQFIFENIEYRDRVFNEIENALKDLKYQFISFDISSDFKNLEFEYKFSNEEERDEIKRRIKEVVSPFQNVLKLEFENELGKTTYELRKNEEWEGDKENEIRKGLRSADFIYLTEKEYLEYTEKVNKFGENANYFGGKQIGSLLRKDKDKFLFGIGIKDLSVFDDIDVDTFKTGYIKPIFIGDNVNIDRMRKAMYAVLQPGGRNGTPINRNLSNFLFDPTYAAETTSSIEDEMEIIYKELNEKNLNRKQLEAVAKSILAKDLALIQGPPGTGKTTVIAEIIWQTVLRNQKTKILLTSQTNLAVDNALERLAEKNIVRPIRIGNIDKLEEEGKQYSYERIINWRDSDEKQYNEHSNNAVNRWLDNIISNCSNDVKYSVAVNKWKELISNKSQKIRKDFSNEYLKNANLIAATCSECGNGRRFTETFTSLFNSENNEEVRFDTVIMDEASKATPPEMIVPLTLGEKMIIIGDHKQLPPMMEENDFVEKLTLVGAQDLVKEWEKEDYKISQFEKLFKNAPKSIVSTLDTQFRMHGKIMKTINHFYLDELKDGLICGIEKTMDEPDFRNKGSRYHGLTLEPFINPNTHAIWINVDTLENKVGTSFENEGEIEAIDLVIKCLLKSSGYDEYTNSMIKDEDKEIGIITFYGPQKGNIDKKIYGHLSLAEKRDFERNKYKNKYKTPFRINTVDKFQGMERNILIVSTVRNNDRKAFGFAKESQRINVAFSRAKRLLIVIGSRDFFMQNPKYSESIKSMETIDIKQLKNLVK